MPCGDTAAMSLVPIVVIITAALLLICWCSWRQPCKYLRTVGTRAVSPMRAPLKQMITFYQVPCKSLTLHLLFPTDFRHPCSSLRLRRA